MFLTMFFFNVAFFHAHCISSPCFRHLLAVCTSCSPWRKTMRGFPVSEIAPMVVPVSDYCTGKKTPGLHGSCSLSSEIVRTFPKSNDWSSFGNKQITIIFSISTCGHTHFHIFCRLTHDVALGEKSPVWMILDGWIHIVSLKKWGPPTWSF